MYVLYIYVQIHVDASKSIREMEIPKYLIMWNRESKNLYIILCIYIYTRVGLYDWVGDEGGGGGDRAAEEQEHRRGHRHRVLLPALQDQRHWADLPGAGMGWLVPGGLLLHHHGQGGCADRLGRLGSPETRAVSDNWSHSDRSLTLSTLFS